MLNKKVAILLCVFVVSVPLVFGQNTGPDADGGKTNGVSLDIALYADIFKLTQRTFGETDIRVQTAQDTFTVNFPISSMDFWTDSEINFGYTGSFFGGNVSLNQEFLKTSMFGGLKGWVRLGFVTVTLGNDIESVYADSLDADPGLRLYTGMEVVASEGKKEASKVNFLSENPDNITADEGLLVEAALSPFNIALAAGEFSSIANLANYVNGTNFYGERYDQSFRYGIRIGYEMGDIGKLNASYIGRGRTIADNYGYEGVGSMNIVPTKPNAESKVHSFGLYASLNPGKNFDLTIGYNGQLTTYLDEFFNGSQGWVKTGFPAVFVNGANLNVRLKQNGLTIRSDHSFSFWNDKNYDSLETYNQSLKDVGLIEAEQASRYVEINHFMIWNGIGVSYNFLEKHTVSMYVNNLFAQYKASGNTPTGNGDYTFFRDQISVEFKFSYKLSINAEVFAKIIVTDLITHRSKDLNAQSKGVFVDYVNNNVSQGVKPVPVETLDNELTIRIPIGVSLKF